MLHLQKALHPSVFLLRSAQWGDELSLPPEYVWREGSPPRVQLLGQAKQRLLSVDERTLLHNFFLVECTVYASAFNKFAQGTASAPQLVTTALVILCVWTRRERIVFTLILYFNMIMTNFVWSRLVVNQFLFSFKKIYIIIVLYFFFFF